MTCRISSRAPRASAATCSSSCSWTAPRARTLPPILRAVATDINFLRLFIQNHAADRDLSATWACECLRVLHDVYGYAPPPPDAMLALAGVGTHMRRAVDRFISTAITLQLRFVDLGIPHKATAHIRRWGFQSSAKRVLEGIHRAPARCRRGDGGVCACRSRRNTLA